jgi:hypothetical protein
MFDEGIREGTDLRIEIGPSAYVNSEISRDMVTHPWFPSPDFREIWEFDPHTARLTERRLSQNWRWIDKRLFRRKELRMIEK